LTAARTFILTAVTMIAFAANSLLCRLALKQTSLDPASFTTIRIVSGALLLWLVCFSRKSKQEKDGSWLSAGALFVYAIAFSLAYRTLSAGTGALLLFGSVQVTMISCGMRRGERLASPHFAGLALAFGGLVVLLFPGLSAPPLLGSGLMVGAGIAWGIYSIRGRSARNPVGATADNFLRAVPFALAASVASVRSFHLDSLGMVYAILSGAVTSGLGYVIWYTILPKLRAISAATMQLSVPLLTATGGILLLGEPLTLRYMIASATVLGGIALVVTRKVRS
jgi:drug/metabolite transporter (DMT)-like permease